MINNSLDWHDLKVVLLRNSRDLKYRRELEKMISNIEKEITELSKAEVDLRRGKKHRAIELLEKVNKDIEVVEEFILVARLST